MSSLSPPAPSPKRKRASCEGCRVRKIKCCGTQPCAACSKQSLDCVYEDSQSRRRSHASRIARLRRQQSKEWHHEGPGSVSLGDHEPLAAVVRPSQDDGEAHRPLPDNPNGLQWTPQASGAWPGNASESDTRPAGADWNSVRQRSQALTEPGLSSWSPVARTNSHPSAQDTASMRRSVTSSTPLQNDLVQDTGAVPSFNDGSIIRPQQQLSYSNSWPTEIDESSLLPWLDTYFTRLHPIVPVLSHLSVYEAMLLGRHRTDRDFGAMILSIVSIVMIQCVYAEEATQLDQRTTLARALMQHSARMRSSWNFGQDPSVETILTSFFLFGCLFSDGQQRAAWHQLRLAVDMTCQMGLDQPDAYPLLEKKEREQKLRIYLGLAVTERACALMRRRSIGLRGRPWSISLSAQQTSMFFDYPTFELDDGQSTREITGLLSLAHIFDGIDEDVIDCWNGRCRKTDGICDTTDRRKILALTRRVMTSDKRLPSDMPTLTASSPLSEAQTADVLITQVWILNRIWHLSMSHGLLQGASEHHMLLPEFAVALACAAALFCRQLKPQSIEVHGVGMLEKISDLAASVQTAKELAGEARIAGYMAEKGAVLQSLSPCVELWQKSGIDTSIPIGTAEEAVSVLLGLISSMRDGRHPYRHPVPT